MILSNSYRKLFYQTGNPIFFLASRQVQAGKNLALPPVEEEQMLNL